MVEHKEGLMVFAAGGQPAAVSRSDEERQCWWQRGPSHCVGALLNVSG